MLAAPVSPTSPTCFTACCAAVASGKAVAAPPKSTIYAEALAQGIGKDAVDPTKLIPPMVARFMATDRAFARLRRAKSKQST